MKLVRFGSFGAEKPGIIDAEGRIRDLSSIVEDIAGETLSDAGLARLAALDLAALPPVADDVRLGAPVAGSVNFVAIGQNYADHAAETGAAVPSEPVVFFKSRGCLVGPNDDIQIPSFSRKTDWEAELAVIIGRTARAVGEDEALAYVAGYSICHDVSEREWQLEHGQTWDKGKSFDTYGPLGPWLVTKDEVADPQNLDIFLDIDGVRKQTGSTRDMIFSVKQIISYVSRFLTLHPGDILSTGTPPGVGIGRQPQEFLRPGQTVRLGISGLGEQMQATVLRPDG